MVLDKRQKLFLVLASVFVTCLVVGDLIGGKLIEANVFGLLTVTLTVGMIPFPVTFLLTDIINEFYGSRAARTVTWVGFAMGVMSITIVSIAVAVPIAPLTRAPDWNGVTDEAFRNAFGGSLRILFASMVAYLAGQFTDVAVFHLLKRWSSNRFLWLRATGSTAVSQMIDTVVINTVAWWGLLSPSKIFALGASSYVVKLLIAIGLTPLIYAGHVIVERLLRIPPVRLDDAGEPIEEAVEPAQTAVALE